MISRLFEMKSHGLDGDVSAIIDLDKVCWLQIEKHPGQHYPHLTVRFVDGYEWRDIMIDQSAHQLVAALRAYLAGSRAQGIPDEIPERMEIGPGSLPGAKCADLVSPNPLIVAPPPAAGPVLPSPLLVTAVRDR